MATHHLVDGNVIQKQMPRYQTLITLVIGILAIFLVRTWLAVSSNPPLLNDIFIAITSIGSLLVTIRGYRLLRKSDWLAALLVGAVVGVGMSFATLFSPYPFWGLVRTNLDQAIARGLYSSLAVIGGLVVMRLGGPIQFHAANGDWRKAGGGVLLGLVIGIPLAVLNVFALQLSQGQSIQWQNPLAALVDALQPGIVEEVVYRFAFWSLLWLVLRKSLPNKAVWLSGVLALLVHNYAHFDDLLLQAPLEALGMGLVMAVVWGLPLAFLAQKRGLEPAVAFHWMQDVTRFLTGF